MNTCACGEPALRHRTQCRACVNAAKRQRYATDPDLRRKASEAQSVRYANGSKRAIYDYYRFKAFEILGGPKCKRCGFADHRALQIDHVNNDGCLRRRISKEMGVTLYRRVVKASGEGYQVLCSNCNWIKRAEVEGRTLENYPTQAPQAPAPRGQHACVRPEDTYAAFLTGKPLRRVASELGVSRNTLAEWWISKFGLEAHLARGKLIQSRAARDFQMSRRVV
jgi:hypothetical protein